MAFRTAPRRISVLDLYRVSWSRADVDSRPARPQSRYDALMSDDRPERRSRFLIPVALFCILLAYPLSIGPMTWVARKAG